ncbi:hypothetical protein BU17DRAFT_75758 [Hysterangium stoloniferum]|nr:hypothetical protein BU17DRAFT_75758 [Hysterangium stoloniferum]
MPKTPTQTSISLSDDWKDEWPYHVQEPWDISTDFPFPRVLEYEVDEGTWMRLDVHPTSGEIVFDLLGYPFCSPRAHPIMLGVPSDGDPQFSPDGEQLAFRSDAILGVDNIWVIPWQGCHTAAIRPNPDLDQSDATLRLASEVLDALAFQTEDEALLLKGSKETPERKQRRLFREGRSQAQRVTNETFRTVTDARFHPSGKSVIASKWYVSSRSIPAGEGWLFDLPRTGDIVQEGAGKRVISRTLPAGWSAERYGDQQIGNEQFIWKDENTLIYAKRTTQEASGVFSYSADIHSGTYAILSRNLITGETETLVSEFPGGASRPELSRDGSTLAFVRRVRDKEALVLMNLRSGTLRNIWYGLTYDATSISAPMGTYPSFAFTPKDDGIIIWAAGKLWRIPITENTGGEKIAGGEPTVIPFKAKIEKRLAETLREPTDLSKTEMAERQRVYAFKELTVDDYGENVLFQAAGVTYLQEVGSSSPPVRVPVLDASATYYSPSFVPNAPNKVLHSKWSETNFTTFELADLSTGTVYDLSSTLPLGRYISPVLCGCASTERKIAFIRVSGDTLTGNIVETRNAGIIVGDISLPSAGHAYFENTPITIRNLKHIPSNIELGDVSLLRLQFIDGSRRLLVEDVGRAFTIDLAGGTNQFGKYNEETLVTAKSGSEVVVSPNVLVPRLDGAPVGVQHAAFLDYYQVYYVEGKNIGNGPLKSKPGDASPGIKRVSVDGGHDIAWSRDGKKLFWLLGPYLHYIEVSSLTTKAEVIPTFQEIAVDYDSEVIRLKADSLSAAIARSDEDLENFDVLAIVNASLLTFETGHFGGDYIPSGIVISKAGVIVKAGSMDEIDVPSGAHVIDAAGGLLIPGYIDVHAHWAGFTVQHPTKSWEMEAFLAYGVTTLHNPSSDNRDGYHERFLVESGKMIGPRIYHTGNIIYGGSEYGIHQDIVNLREARSALLRIKAEGGPSSFSYKNYALPSRASRQRLLLAARNLSMLAVPEGGMNYDWDLTYIIDGMATIEHAIPIPVLYDDVLTLYAESGTATTPTHIVNYGGVMGEQLVWATEDVVNDPKLRRLTRHDRLQGISESTSRPKDSFALFNTSASVAKMVKRGAWANIGAHGEAPLGFMYHSEMQFTLAGGLDEYEVLRAATRDGALSLGLFGSIGSLSTGKLADMVLYPEGIDFDHFQNLAPSKDLRYVIKGGRVFDASTMAEEWPVKGRKQVLPVLNAD